MIILVTNYQKSPSAGSFRCGGGFRLSAPASLNLQY